MKVSKYNEILEATLQELRQEWKRNEYDQLYTFDKYVDIMINHNKVKIVAEPTNN
jgi:hypothetical protein